MEEAAIVWQNNLADYWRKEIDKDIIKYIEEKAKEKDKE